MSIVLPTNIPFKIALIGALGALLLSAGLGTGLVLTRARLATVKAEYAGFIDKVEATTQRIRALGLERKVRVMKAQNDITVEISNGYATDLADLRSRYQRLRAQANSGRGRASSVPVVPPTTSGFNVCTGYPGLLCVPTETAVDLMQQADENTLKLVRLQQWVGKQVTVPVE